MTKKRSISAGKPQVNPELEGFDIKINSFGEIKSNFDIDRINEFLNDHVDDKKLREREETIQKKEDTKGLGKGTSKDNPGS